MKETTNTLVLKTLLDLGISPNTKGYRYLRDSILRCVSCENKTAVSNKMLYIRLAEDYETTEASIERAVRHAIKSGWYRHNEELAERIFMNTLQSTNDIPTNSVFIYTVSEWIRITLANEEEQ